MLILPMHHRVGLRNLPWMSLVLAALCIVVHLGPQAADETRLGRAEALYRTEGLAAIEAPLFLIYRRTDAPALLPPSDIVPSAEALAPAMRQDRGFRLALASGVLFADPQAHAGWLRRSAAYRELMAAQVSERFAMASDAPTVRGALGSQFLHADLGHLAGNLVFLLVLGLLVERALGPWLHLGLYLISGMAAAWAWALLHHGPPSLLVGASGAIAGLMGALAVLWGLRRIRFFYWFFVVFDYVRWPALWLLPVWLGWELLQWATEGGSQVAYQAHAGGIVTGALLAWGVRWRGWDRAEAYADDPADALDEAAVLGRAQTALGRLDFPALERELAPLLAQATVPVAARLLALRAAQTAGRSDEALVHARALLRPGPATERAGVLESLAAWRRGGGRWSAHEALDHALQLLSAGRGDEAASVLVDAASGRVLPDDFAGAWLRLAFDQQRHGDAVQARALFDALARTLPHTPEAAKAAAQLD